MLTEHDYHCASLCPVNVTPCGCGSHAQHAIFKLLWYHPEVSLKQAAEEMKIPYANVKVYVSRMRKKQLERRCPECFRLTLVQLVRELRCRLQRSRVVGPRGSIRLDEPSLSCPRGGWARKSHWVQIGSI